MATEYTLLERIDRAEEAPDRRLALDLGTAVDSVIRHLSQLLNVRQGCVEALPDYGMPDFNDVIAAHSDPIQALKRGIRDMISRYEPRLANVRVVHLKNEDDPLDLRFKVTAQLVLAGENTNVEIETVVGDGGRVTVEG
ncbi:MAG: type VI secretion system baseplate subunit TssE [Rhodothalassiaceae bacterium]